MRIGLVYPDVLGTYGDRGNAAVLAARLRRRGLPAELVTVLADDAVPATLDCYVIGGGEDHAQRAVAARLVGSPIARAWRDGAVIVAVCAGFQMLGTSFVLGDGEELPGLGVIDASTVRSAGRRVGEVVLDATDPSLGAITGFENHRGVTEVRSPLAPLGRAAGSGEPEGVLDERILATYLHGPVLVRNPALADRVLRWIVPALPALDADLADALHCNLVERFGAHPSRWRPGRRAGRR